MGCNRAVAPLAQRPGAGRRKPAGEPEKHRINFHTRLHTRPKRSDQSYIYRQKELRPVTHTLYLRPDQKQILRTTHEPNNTISNSQTVPPDMALALPGARMRRPDGVAHWFTILMRNDPGGLVA